jgi:hypothetical protein
MTANSDNDDSEEVWNARADALAPVLGDYGNVFHSPHAFDLGGSAEVMAFYEHLDGAVYVTADLTRKPDASYADYELMICHRTREDDWGPNVISRLAPYTQEAYIAAGESMDIDQATPPESAIKAFLFDTYGTFTLFGEPNELRLCIGITKPELEFKMEHGSDKLLALLKRRGVYPFTDLTRDTIPFEPADLEPSKGDKQSWMGRLFGKKRDG